MKKGLLVTVCVVLVVGMFVIFAPVGCDYHIFKNAALAWVRGESQLFDAAAPGFFYAPWSLALYLPLAYLPDKISSGLINAASVAALFWASYILVGRAPWVVYIVAIANIWTANLIGATQFDAFSTAAVALGFWSVNQRQPHVFGLALALAVIGMKPTNVVIPGLLLCTYAACSWDIKRMLAATVIPGFALMASFAMSGVDWLPRYAEFVAWMPPNAGYNVSFWVALWRGVSTLELSIMLIAVIGALWALVISIRQRQRALSLILGLVLNLMLSPYVTIYHYAQTVPALIWLGRRDTVYLILLYLASLAWVVIREPMLPVFPAALSVCIMHAVTHSKRACLPASAPLATAGDGLQ